MPVKTLFLKSMLAASVAAVGCGGRLAYNLPPAQRLMEPGPGVGGPGPGVIPVGNQMTAGGPPAAFGPGGTPPAYGATQCQYCEGGCGDSAGYGGGCYDGSCSTGGAFAGGHLAGGPSATSQIAFLGEEGLQITWDVSGAGMFDSAALFVPGRQDFPQGAIYRLKLQNIPGRAGLTLYPTLEVAPVTPRTDAYLAHAPVPVQFTEEDFDQVVSGNFVTKVIYLPAPEFQELALSGVETLVSTRLDPGVDPVSEADRRGSILAILRMGSKDLEGMPGASQGVVPAQFSGEMIEGTPIPPQPGHIEGGHFNETYVGGHNHIVSPQPAGPPIQAEPIEGYVSGGHEGYVSEGPVSQGHVGGGYGAANMPVGAPTSGFAPNPVPPHMIAGMPPQYGMPYVGTPIGLPGPPHIPLGSPAGLRKHVMKNRTRVVLPPPTNQVKISVKQRPGMNYPKPVNNVTIDEVHRAPLQLMGGTVPPPSCGLCGNRNCQGDCR